MSTELQVVNGNQQITKLGNFQSAEEMTDFASYLIKGGYIPKGFNKPEMVTSVVLQGRELGFEPLTALNNMYSIAGRATLSVHGIAALMQKKGIVTKTIKYFEPKLKADGAPSGDFETVIRFYQPFMNTIIEEDCSFTWKEAEKMGLLSKDPWVKMPKIMLYNRCLAIGARRVAPDALLGIYETSEAADFSNVKYQVDQESGAVTIL